jgi:hypothetical protein
MTTSVFHAFDNKSFDIAMDNYNRPPVEGLDLPEHWAWPHWGDAKNVEFSVLGVYRNRITDELHVRSLWPLQSHELCAQLAKTHDCVRFTPGELQNTYGIRKADHLFDLAADDVTIFDHMLKSKKAAQPVLV